MHSQAKRFFASDNSSGIHPEVQQAIVDANVGHVKGYGDDEYTARAVAAFRDQFGANCEVFFVFNGSAANILSVAGVCAPHHALICADTSHIHISECGGIERFAGCRALAAAAPDGKLTIAAVQEQVHGIGSVHINQPRMISITQATEFGTLYSISEIRSLADFAHERGMLLHLDGARIANAAAAQELSLRAATRDAGVDVLSFGGTKNGLLIGEAVVFFDAELARDFQFVHKQGMQLASKMRFVSAQFEALLRDDLWRRSALHANLMAARLGEKVSGISGVELRSPVQTNGVHALIPTPCVEELQQEFFFYSLGETGSKSWARWMASFDTTAQDVDDFAAAIERIVGGHGG